MAYEYGRLLTAKYKTMHPYVHGVCLFAKFARR